MSVSIVTAIIFEAYNLTVGRFESGHWSSESTV